MDSIGNVWPPALNRTRKFTLAGASRALAVGTDGGDFTYVSHLFSPTFVFSLCSPYFGGPTYAFPNATCFEVPLPRRIGNAVYKQQRMLHAYASTSEQEYKTGTRLASTRRSSFLFPPPPRTCSLQALSVSDSYPTSLRRHGLHVHLPLFCMREPFSRSALANQIAFGFWALTHGHVPWPQPVQYVLWLFSFLLSPPLVLASA